MELTCLWSPPLVVFRGTAGFGTLHWLHFSEFVAFVWEAIFVCFWHTSAGRLSKGRTLFSPDLDSEHLLEWKNMKAVHVSLHGSKANSHTKWWDLFCLWFLGVSHQLATPPQLYVTYRLNLTECVGVFISVAGCFLAPVIISFQVRSTSKLSECVPGIWTGA